MEDNRDMTRFFKYVSIQDGCWNWIGASLPRGYGRFYFRGKPRYAHRVSLELHGVEVPDGLNVLHACDNPRCVNPNHLSVGTQQDNMRDARDKGRIVNVQDWRGTRNPKAKLSTSERAKVEEMIRGGVGSRIISDRFGITQVRVQQIAREIIAVTARTKRDGGGWNIEEF